MQVNPLQSVSGANSPQHFGRSRVSLLGGSGGLLLSQSVQVGEERVVVGACAHKRRVVVCLATAPLRARFHRLLRDGLHLDERTAFPSNRLQPQQSLLTEPATQTSTRLKRNTHILLEVIKLPIKTRQKTTK